MKRAPYLLYPEKGELNDVHIVKLIMQADNDEIPFEHRVIVIDLEQFEDMKKIDLANLSTENPDDSPMQFVGETYGCKILLVR